MQDSLISEALGPWAAKILRHVRVPGDCLYLDLLQQETVRLLTLEFMSVMASLGRGVCGSLWPDTSRVCSLACRLSFATALKIHCSYASSSLPR